MHRPTLDPPSQGLTSTGRHRICSSSITDLVAHLVFLAAAHTRTRVVPSDVSLHLSLRFVPFFSSTHLILFLYPLVYESTHFDTTNTMFDCRHPCLLSHLVCATRWICGVEAPNIRSAYKKGRHIRWPRTPSHTRKEGCRESPFPLTCPITLACTSAAHTDQVHPIHTIETVGAWATHAESITRTPSIQFDASDP